MPLPTDATARKNVPVYSGFMCYFPDAIAEVATLSKIGNDQHNPGAPLHWDRAKSTDEMDALCRHMLDGTHKPMSIPEQIEHQRAVAWRAMARLQKLCEWRDEIDDTIREKHPVEDDEYETESYVGWIRNKEAVDEYIGRLNTDTEGRAK